MTWVQSSSLNTGVTRASFQQSGSFEVSIDLLNNKDKGMLSSSAHSLRQKSGQPSGPGTLLGSSCDSLSNTTDGVMVMVVSGDWQTSDN